MISNFSRGHFEIFSSFFFFQNIGFDITCKLLKNKASIWDVYGNKKKKSQIFENETFPNTPAKKKDT